MNSLKLSLILTLALGCAPELIEQRPTESKGPEENAIVPVGGYQVLNGEWLTVRRDEVIREQSLVMLFEVEGDVIAAQASEGAVRLRCQAQYRKCLGDWYDNLGRGRVVLTFSKEWNSFVGSYDGQSAGRDIGRSTWTGSKR